MNSKLNMSGWKVCRLTPSRVDTPEGSISISWGSNSDGGERERKAEEAARLIAAAPDLLSSLSKKVNDAEQALFDEWLESKLPSGDHEEVQCKWLNSSEYNDFFVEWSEQIEAISKATGESA